MTNESEKQENGTAVGGLIDPVVMSNLEYRDVMWAEMKPDVYDGDKCDQVRPRWWAYADGDMDGDFIEKIDIDCKHFPAGTKISVSVPCCPKCHQDADMCESDDGCDFDWKHLVECEYS